MQQSIIDDGSQDRDIGILADLAKQWVEVGEPRTLVCRVNQHLKFGPEVPLAGAKQSGIGVEWSDLGLAEFCQINIINEAA